MDEENFGIKLGKAVEARDTSAVTSVIRGRKNALQSREKYFNKMEKHTKKKNAYDSLDVVELREKERETTIKGKQTESKTELSGNGKKGRSKK